MESMLPALICEQIKSIPSPVCIADIGTSDGFWLEDLSKYLPDGSMLDGYDLMDEMSVLPLRSPPPKVNLFRIDVAVAFPAELYHKYDVVHIKLLLPELPTGWWRIIPRNVMDLLKPGGWFVWEEYIPVMKPRTPTSAAWSRYVEITSNAAPFYDPKFM